MKNKANEYDNTFFKNIARVAVVLVVVFVLIYSGRASKNSGMYDETDSRSAPESAAGIRADTISSQPVSEAEISMAVDVSSDISSDVSTHSDAPSASSEVQKLLIPNERIHTGSLILIDESHICTIDGDSTVPLSDYSGNGYTLVDDNILLSEKLIEGLNDMTRAFMDRYNNQHLAIANGYVSYEQQSSMQSSDGSSTDYLMQSDITEKPGYSEHQTGYAFDLCIYDSEANRYDKFSPHGDYSWISDNCHRFGFITRFPEGKADKTSKDYQPWHLRYVGTAHSTAMAYNDFCLEEYLEYVKRFTYEGQHLTLTDSEMNNWEIYYIPMDAESNTDETVVTVPKDSDYSISGDNASGFIITIKL